jgi:primosomal protein N' (replication factor Y)
LFFTPGPSTAFASPVIARVALDIALGKEFDYLVPPELEAEVEVGRRVKVPFGQREVLGNIISLPETSPHAQLRPLTKLLGVQTQLTPEVLELARWMAEYYCCPVETALKSVLPDSVRREQDGWRKRLTVRLLPVRGDLPELTKRQKDLWNILEEWRELPLQELVRLAGTTAETVRRLEDKGLLAITSEIAERDPYAADQILPTDAMTLNAAVFLLHGVTGSGKTEVYLQAIAHAWPMGRAPSCWCPEISLTPQTVERFKARFNHGPAAHARRRPAQPPLGRRTP